MTDKMNTILIVDDVPINLEILVDYLRHLNFEVYIAENGKEALEKVVKIPPDLILLDIMMPVIDGFEVCRRLKADKKTCDIPIIFMTALSDVGDKLQAFQMGAVDYVTKPIRREEVLARIKTHLMLRKLQKQLKVQNIQLEQKNHELQQQNAELEAFAHTVAHDLKSPVNLITGFSELLIEEFSSSFETEAQEMLKKVIEAGWNIANIIDALLLLASTRHEQVVMGSLDMSEIVVQAQNRLASMIEKHQSEILLPKQWPVAQGYAPWIAEVWTTYLSNAIKYGGNPPRLELGATPQENTVRFWVRDNGQGLTQEQQSHLFVPFTRISQARIEGHGLGLSIVLRIIEKCGGQVGVESQIGKGSTFYFCLPK